MFAERMATARSTTCVFGLKWFSGVMLSVAMSMSCAVRAENTFVDPLDQPAAVMSALHSKPLRDITRSGQRLVAVGESGLIVFSDDNGVRWSQASVPVSTDFNAVHFSNERQGWAVGHGASILNTQDGGKTWSKQLDGRELEKVIRDYFSGGQSGLVAERAQVYLDAILNMTRPGPGQFFMGVWFDAAGQKGYAVGPFGLFLASENGGQSWQPLNTQIENDDLLHLTSIREVGGQLAITGERGYVWIQNAETKRFEVRETGYSGTLFGVAGTANVMLAYGLRGHVFRSLDAGLSWTSVDNHFNTGVVAGAALADGSMVLVSQSAQVVTTDLSGSQLRPVAIKKPSLFTGVVGISSTQFALVGLNGVTIQTR